MVEADFRRAYCLLVKELMNHSYPSIYADELATKARAVLRDRNLRVLPITDEKKRLVGTLSRRNIMILTSSISPIRIKGIMTQPPFVATMDMDALQALKEMNRLDKWYIAVVKTSQDKIYMGMLGLENFIAAFLKKGSPKLTPPVSKIMSTEVVTCLPEDEIDNVWRWMQERKFSGCPVVRKKRLVGIVTQADMLDSGSFFPAFEAKKGRFKKSSKISSVMKTYVFTLKPTTTLREAAKLLLKKNVGQLPVIDEKGELVGMVDREDIVKSLV
jgi:CBS domain-containing protein